MRHLLFIVCVVLSHFASAASESKRLQYRLKNGGELRATLPEGWSLHQNIFGVPLMALGPEGSVKRAVVSFSQTNAEAISFDDVALEKKQNEYEDGRLRWLKKRGGSLTAFIPYRVEKLQSRTELRRIGFRYELGGQAFEEEMILSQCHKSLVFVSTLLPSAVKAKHGAEMEALLASLSCR